MFRCLKSLAGPGHLPKHDDDSAEARLCGKRLTALLAEKSLHQARAVPPGGATAPPCRDRSAWREYALVHGQIVRAIERALPLADMLADSRDVSRSLSEAPQARTLQMERYFQSERGTANKPALVTGRPSQSALGDRNSQLTTCLHPRQY